MQMDEPICYLDAHCDVTHEPMPRQTDASSIVWKSFYGRTDSPPSVTWVSRGDCPDGPGFSVYSGGCAVGIYRPAEDQAWAMVGQWDTFAHELLHAALGREGDSDHDHTNPAWKGVYPAAVKALADAGISD
jgi:hypothetical protein